MSKKVTVYIATRGVSWRNGDGWVNREAGDDISDAPAGAIKEWLAYPAESPAAVTDAEWAAMNPKEATNG